MKKLFLSTLLAMALVPATFAEEVVYNDYQNVGYNKTTNWECAQGLCSDGVYYYFAGHNDRTNEGADIHKIRIFDNKEISVFAKKGPLHSAELLWYQPHDSILACSGGNTRKPFVWELNKKTGDVLNKWDFAGIGENGGALIAWIKDNNIILFTSSGDGAKIAFTKVFLQDGGKSVLGDTWYYSVTDLGVPQGMDYLDGFIYYLADAGKTINDNPHAIYKIKLEDDEKKTVNILEEYRVNIGKETEGLSIDPNGNVLFGSAEERIYQLKAKYNELRHFSK